MLTILLLSLRFWTKLFEVFMQSQHVSTAVNLSHLQSLWPYGRNIGGGAAEPSLCRSYLWTRVHFVYRKASAFSYMLRPFATELLSPLATFQLLLTTSHLATTCPLSVTRHRFPLTTCPLPVFSYRLPFIPRNLPLANYSLPVPAYHSPVPAYHSPVPAYHSPVLACQLQLTTATRQVLRGEQDAQPM